MKHFETLIKAICPKTKELLIWQGPYIPAYTKEEAQDHIDRNGLGYCKLTGQWVIYEVPTDSVGKPVWNKLTNFENLN